MIDNNTPKGWWRRVEEGSIGLLRLEEGSMVGGGGSFKAVWEGGECVVMEVGGWV
jgi:hypothetical protein